MNTPIYVALLVAVAPAAKARLASYLAHVALADRAPVARPRLQAALIATADDAA